MRDDGKTLDEIATALHTTRSNIMNYSPYNKGMYKAEYPTTNALRIRACRKGRK